MPGASSAGWPSGRGGRSVDVTLLASRPRASAGPPADPLARFGRPCARRRCPGRLLTRAWDLGWSACPPGLRRRPLGLAGLPAHRRRSSRAAGGHGARRGLAPSSRGHHPAGRAMARGRPVPGPRLGRVAGRHRPGSWPADLDGDGRGRARITIVPGGSDHLRPRTRGHRRAAGPARRDRRVPPHRRHARAAEEPRPAAAQAYGRCAAPLPEPWPLVIVGPDRLGAPLAEPPSAGRRRLRRRGLRRRAGRPVPAGPAPSPTCR